MSKDKVEKTASGYRVWLGNFYEDMTEARFKGLISELLPPGSVVVDKAALQFAYEAAKAKLELMVMRGDPVSRSRLHEIDDLLLKALSGGQ